MEGKISVIIPVFNVEAYLEECVNSVLGQTEKSLEIILVDDGSEDASGSLCDELAKKDERIQVIHKENGGLASARNAGIIKAEGEYISFLDSDDYLEKDTYQECLLAMQEHKAQIACFDRFRVVEEEGGWRVFDFEYLTKEQVVMDRQEGLKELILNKMFNYSACDKVFERRLFEGLKFPEDRLPSEDVPCIYEVFKRAEKIVHIGKQKYYYRKVADSITSKPFTAGKLNYVRQIALIYEDASANLPELEQEAFYEYIQAIECYYAVMVQSKNHKDFWDVQKRMEKEISKRLREIDHNPYINRNVRFLSRLIALGAYPFVSRVMRWRTEY